MQRKTTMTPHPPAVILDCDTGIDDSLALVYLAALHHAGEITLKAVTTTAGNVDAHQCALNSRHILNLLNLPEIPVAVGQPHPLVVELTTTPETHGDTGLGYYHAPTAGLELYPDWRELWRHNLTNTTHLIVTGPATNLATWLRGGTWPAHLTLMGGAYLYPGNTTPTAEWNSWVDPHAAKEVFAAAEASAPITVCSLGVTEQMLITPEILDTLIAELDTSRAVEFLPDALRFYFEFHQAQGEGYQAQIHDLLTCMIALGTIEAEHTDVSIDVEAESELLRGTTIADFKNHWARPTSARLITNANIEQAHLELLRAIQVLAKHNTVR